MKNLLYIVKVGILIVFIIIFNVACNEPTGPVTLVPANLEATAIVADNSNITPIALATNTHSAATVVTPSATATAVTIKLILWENLPPNQAQQLSQDVAAFNHFYPNVIIDIQHYDDAETLATAIVEERVDYDLLLGSAPLLAPLQQVNKIQPMSQLYSSNFLNQFASATLAGASRNGEVWGLPDTAGFHLLLFFNKELVETPPTSTKALVELTTQHKPNTQWPLVFNSYDPLWLLPWLWSYGGWLTDATGTPTLNSEAMISTLTLYANWQKAPNGLAPLATHIEARNMFITGQAAMLIDGAWAIDELAQEATIPWGVAPLPMLDETGQTPGPLVLGRYWAVSNQTTGRHIEVATAFIEFVTRSERQLSVLNKFGLLPTRREALAAPIILTDPILRASAQQLQAGQGVPLGVNLNAILDAMRLPLEQLLTNSLSPVEAANLMQQQAQ